MARKSSKSARPAGRAAVRARASKATTTRAGAKKGKKKSGKKNGRARRQPHPLSSGPLHRAFEEYEKRLRKALPGSPELQGVLDSLLRAKEMAPHCPASGNADEIPPMPAGS